MLLGYDPTSISMIVNNLMNTTARLRARLTDRLFDSVLKDRSCLDWLTVDRC